MVLDHDPNRVMFSQLRNGTVAVGVVGSSIALFKGEIMQTDDNQVWELIGMYL